MNFAITMNRKRSLINSISNLKRKKDSFSQCETNIYNTPATLSYIASLFPTEKFEKRLPPIIMKHQIYAMVKNRTEVDKCLNEMRKKGDIRLFRLGQNDNEIAVVYMKDYEQHVKQCCSNNTTVGKFLNLVTRCTDISYSKNALLKVYGFKEGNITELIQQGLMTARDVGCYWLSIPQIGEFVKTLFYGRRVTLQHLKRTKYKELLQSELEARKLPTKARLGMHYHIYDIIGSDLVTCVDTSMGVVLRLRPESALGNK